jgi:hypothetical protein
MSERSTEEPIKVVEGILPGESATAPTAVATVVVALIVSLNIFLRYQTFFG